MNTDAVEKLLRKAPPVRTPAGLLQDLQSEIALPQHESRITHREPLSSNRWLRRWLPALGFALWFFGCVVVFGLQANWINELRQQKRALESATATTAQQAFAAEGSRSVLTAELEQLKKDLADVQRLRAEVEQLRAEMLELAALRTQNRQLREKLQAHTAAPPPKPKEDFFAIAADRAARTRCINNLKQVGLAARIWANKNKLGTLPPDTESLKLYLSRETLLFCPADETTSYEILSPGAPENHPEIVYACCPIHNNAGMVDGSAQMLGSQGRVVQRDGKWVLER
jgi:hypothetical protein